MAEYPHCNPDVLHAPGTCVYCDEFSERQAVRAAGGTPFTPAESNGWSGNVAVKAGQEHTHMGVTYVVPGPRSLRGLRSRIAAAVRRRD